MIIEVRDLRRRFGAFEAVRGVSFTVERGEIFGYLGANGAGKSTTIRILCGLLEPSAGRAIVAGHDVARDPTAVRRRVGVEPGLRKPRRKIRRSGRRRSRHEERNRDEAGAAAACDGSKEGGDRGAHLSNSNLSTQ